MTFVKKLIFIILGLLCLLSATYALNADSNLLAHYELKNDVLDSSTNSNDGTNHGVSFDGSSGAFVPNDYFDTNVNLPSSDYSIGLEVYRTADGAWYSLFSSAQSIGGSGISGKVYGDIYDALYWYTGSSNQIINTESIADFIHNTWYGLVYTCDSSGNAKIYVNGSLYASGTGCNEAHDSSLEIGKFNLDIVGSEWRGYMREVTLWDRALNPTDVSSLFNNGVIYLEIPTINHNIQDFYNTENIFINLNTTLNANMSYELDNGTNTNICLNCNSTVLNLNSLSEGAHSILFISENENGQANSTATFTIDLTYPIPNLSNIDNVTFSNPDYVYFNWSVSELYLSTCSYKIDNNSYSLCTNSTFGEVNTTSLIAGNHTFTVNATDLAGNSNISSVNFTYSPYNIEITFRSSLTNNLLTNLTFYDVNFTNNITVNGSTLMLQHNLGTYNYTVYKDQYVTQSGSYEIVDIDNILIIYLNPIFNISLLDERTLEAFNISGTESVFLQVVCDDDTTTQIEITTQNFQVPIECNYKKFKFNVNYVSSNYYRTVALDENLLDFDIYLIDLLTTQSIFDSFIIIDLNDRYENPQLRFYKNINGTAIQITGDYLDAQDKVGAYLIFGDQYTLRLYSDNQPVKSIGFFSADVAASINLRLIDLNFQPGDSYYDGGVILNSYYETSETNTTLFATYNNTKLDTLQVTYSVYNTTEFGSLLYTDTVVGEDVGSFSYLLPNTYQNYTFYTKVDLTRTTVTQHSIREDYLRPSGQLVLGIDTTNINIDWVITITLAVLALVFTAATATVGGILLLLIASFFTFVGWYHMAWGFIGLGLAIGFIKFLREGDKK